MTRRLLLLNGLCALAIPVHHAAAYGLQAMFQWTDRYRNVTVPNYDALWSFPFEGLMTARHLMGFAVPGFLLVSGFYVAFMVRRNDDTVTLRDLVPRMRILLIPLALWTCFRFVMLLRVPAGLNEILNPYFYIPLLFQFLILSPLLVIVARRNAKALLATAGLMFAGIIALRYCELFGIGVPGLELFLSLPRWLFFLYPLWFPLGLVIGLNTEAFRKWLERYRWAFVGMSMAFAVSTAIEYRLVAFMTGSDWLGPHFGGFSRQLYALSLIFCLLSFDFRVLGASRAISRLSMDSLGIYMVNIPAIYATALLMYHLTPYLLGIQLLYSSLLAAAGLAGPLALMHLVRSTPARPYYRHLFG